MQDENESPFERTLVTGAAGFIGSHFAKTVWARDDVSLLVSLDKLTYAGDKARLSAINDEKHCFIEGDIADSNLVGNVLREFDIKTIVNFAAETHVDNSIEAPSPFIFSNIVGTFNLLEEAKRYWLDEQKFTQDICRFHHISTDEVYGELASEDEAFTEATSYAPSSPYAASKASSDHLVRAYYRTYGLPVTLSNCSNNFGPDQHPEKLIPKVIRCCLNQEPIPIYGNGRQIRDWLYVRDHCEAICTILEKGELGETYNIGANNELDNLSLVTHICSIMGKCYNNNFDYKKLIQFVDDRPGHDFRYAINNRKITERLHWQPRFDFIDALEETITDYLSLFDKGGE